MAKKVVGEIRLQLPAGAANPAPPVGPALGAKGVNIMAFCKEFNAKTKDQAGMILPVIISVYQDKSFTFILKSPPASVLLKKAAKIESGSKVPNRDKVVPKIEYNLGERVKITDGPFANLAGNIDKIEPDRGMLQVSVDIFGRSTPVELQFWQVERDDRD